MLLCWTAFFAFIFAAETEHMRSFWNIAHSAPLLTLNQEPEPRNLFYHVRSPLCRWH